MMIHPQRRFDYNIMLLCTNVSLQRTAVRVSSFGLSLTACQTFVYITNCASITRFRPWLGSLQRIKPLELQILY
jgi:hypothetical protein